MTRLLHKSSPMLALSLGLLLPLGPPALAEEPPEKGFSLIEEGAKLMLRGLMTEMEPALDEMDKALTEMGPMLEDLGPKFAELLKLMGDFRNFDAPVVLENGDILIRRKPTPPPSLDPVPGPNGEIEL